MPVSRRIAAILIVATVVAPSPAAIARSCWRPPVAALIVDHFREPACRWCPGNRGVEFATAAGDRVVAVAGGEVSFSGSVAGVEYVVVGLADGLRVTYGNLADRAVATGDRVVEAMLIGHAAGPLHLGLRDGDRYLDPEPMIGELRGVPRLVPSDGSAAPPAPPPVLTCRDEFDRADG